MIDMLQLIFTPHFLFTVLRLTTPLIFAAMSALMGISWKRSKKL